MANRPLPPGVTPDLMSSIQHILSGYSGGGGLEDIMRHLSRQDPNTVNALLDAVADAKESSQVDLEAFDYSSLRVKPESFWVVQLAHMGFADRTGRAASDPFPGSQPTFQIVIYDEKTCYRAAEGYPEPGLPPSDFVLKTIKQAFASPVPPLRPALPNLMLIARKLGDHVPHLRPFLDSLPAPFTWRLETAEEEEQVASGVHEMNIAGVAKGIQTAETEKTRGNQAFAKKNRVAAVQHYTDAIDELVHAAAQKPTDAEEKKIKGMLAVCFANRAAAYLLPGEGQDAQKALEDADQAIKQDAEYSKAYYRKAKAQLLLLKASEAIDTLTAALSNPNFASEKGLNDALVEAYGGFPEDADALRKFCLNIFRNEAGDKRARHLVEFRRRAEAKLQEVIGVEASLETL